MNTLRLDVWPEGHPGVGAGDVLSAAGREAMSSSWAVTRVDDHDEYFDAHGDRSGELEGLVASAERVDWTAIAEILGGVTQVVWGRFNAFRHEHDVEPWLTITFVDSTYIDVSTDDHAVMAAVTGIAGSA